MFRWRYFSIVCNENKYKMMGQGACQGQLYNVQNEIKISKKHWLGLRIYYNSCFNVEISSYVIGTKLVILFLLMSADKTFFFINVWWCHWKNFTFDVIRDEVAHGILLKDDYQYPHSWWFNCNISILRQMLFMMMTIQQKLVHRWWYH